MKLKFHTSVSKSSYASPTIYFDATDINALKFNGTMNLVGGYAQYGRLYLFEESDQISNVEQIAYGSANTGNGTTITLTDKTIDISQLTGFVSLRFKNDGTSSMTCKCDITIESV